MTSTDAQNPSPSFPTLQRTARYLARQQRHTLGRFARSEPEHGVPYALARCQSCLTAAVVVSPTRYLTPTNGSLPRTMGGAALRTECPTPFQTDAAMLVDQSIDDDELDDPDTLVLDPRVDPGTDDASVEDA